MALKPEEYKKRVERLRELKKAHNEEWLTMNVADEYYKKASTLDGNNALDVGERRRLRIELQERYDLLAIGAINILNGQNITDYVDKYHRIKNLIVSPGRQNE